MPQGDQNKLDKKLFCPLVKVDQAKREVWGVVTGESVDRDNEVCDYESTVPYYKQLVAEMSKATDGANIFPLRVMHGLVAAGKGIAIEFHDDDKQIYMGFKVVDDNEWKKVQENVYTGFSQGGRYVKRWQDGEVVRYTSKPIEVSLVDLPCLPDATFDFIRTDGVIEVRKFSFGQGVGELPARPADVPETVIPSVSTCSCSCANCIGGNCTDCSNGNCGKVGKKMKCLITDSKGIGHLPYAKEDGKPDHRLMANAWASLHDGFRGKAYGGPNKEKAQKKLRQLYAQEGIDTPSEKSTKLDKFLTSTLENVIQSRAYGQLGKGMYTIGSFARILEDIKFLWMSLEWEREAEMDDSPVTDEVRDAYEMFLEHLLTYVEEEVEEEKERMSLI